MEENYFSKRDERSQKSLGGRGRSQVSFSKGGGKTYTLRREPEPGSVEMGGGPLKVELRKKRDRYASRLALGDTSPKIAWKIGGLYTIRRSKRNN